jgi:hypothetical protein
MCAACAAAMPWATSSAILAAISGASGLLQQKLGKK